MSMDIISFLLGKLAEEASELAHAALKAQTFGLYATHPDTNESNIDQITRELNDVMGVIELLKGFRHQFTDLGHPRNLRAKGVKIATMLKNACVRDPSLEGRLGLEVMNFMEVLLNPPALAAMDSTISMTFEDYNDPVKGAALEFFIGKDTQNKCVKLPDADSVEFWRMPFSSELFEMHRQVYSNEEWIKYGWVKLDGKCTTIAGFLKNSDPRIAQLFFRNAFNCISVPLPNRTAYAPFNFTWEDKP